MKLFYKIPAAVLIVLGWFAPLIMWLLSSTNILSGGIYMMVSHLLYGLMGFVFILFIAIIAAFTQLVEMVVEKFSPSLYASLGIFLPLIAVNCAILGGSLFMQQKAFPNVGVATVYGLGSGIGWMLAIVGMAAIREKLAYSDIPKPLKGLGITFIITGLMGMAFMCFSGLKI